MQPKKIIIATLFIFLLAQVLSGCSITTTNTPTKEASKLIQISKLGEEIQKTVNLELLSTRKGDSVTIQVILKNPKNKAITSSEAWLSFDPSKLQGVNINTDSSDFSLTAPYKEPFDNINGVVRLGRSNGTALTKSSITIAEVTFDVIKQGTTMIDFYDYKEDLSGHASANIVINSQPYNLLKKPVSPALIIQ